MTDQTPKPLSVAVITSSIGRPHLEKAILSVQNQSYPCKHYVFVDGEQYHDNAKAILQKYPNVCATYLPMNTGGGGWTNSSINAIAPFLVKEDIICYLDDDNTYLSNHVESIVHVFNTQDVDYVHTLRNLVDENGKFICQDKVESIGTKPCSHNKILFHLDGEQTQIDIEVGVNKNMIDTNCFSFRTHCAKTIALHWTTSKANDRSVFIACQNLALKFACTNLFTVDYFFEPKKAWGHIYQVVQEQLPNKNIDDIIQNMLKACYSDNDYDPQQH